MRSVATRRLVGAACGFLTLTGSQAALAMDKYIDLDPPQTKSGLGYGYNSISREFVLRSCVQFAPGVTEGGSGASGDDFKFNSIISNSQLADEMGLSVATKFSASMGVASASSSSKVDFFKSTKTNFLTHTILASYNNVEPMKYIAGDLTLKPEFLAMVGTPEFRAKCGDYVIIGEQQGRWFYGTVQLVDSETRDRDARHPDGRERDPDGEYGRRVRDDGLFRRPEGGDSGGADWLDSDWAGRAILDRYLVGGGRDWTIQDNPEWSQYMMDHNGLARELDGQVRGQAQQSLNEYLAGHGAQRDYSAQFAATTQNGESITGGVGSVWRTFVGALIVQVVRIGMTFMGVSVFAQQIVFGFILVAAVAVTMDRTKVLVIK